MTTIHLDIETYSAADLPAVGAWRYAQDASTRVLMAAYAIDDAPVKLWETHAGPMPPDLRLALDHPGILKVAHNAAFELAVLSTLQYIEFRPEEWRCTMVHAMGLGLPGGLGAVARELKLPEQKSDPGKRLVRRFSCPPGPTKAQAAAGIVLPQPGPEDGSWGEFCAYCMQDVRTEREVGRALNALRPLLSSQWALWAIDQRINARGLPVDLALVTGAIACDEHNRTRAEARVRGLTGVANPNSRDQILAWLRDAGVEPDDLRAQSVRDLLKAGDLPMVVTQVLEQRQQLAASSTAKYDALRRAAGAGDRVRGVFQFNGAHTGRWAGRIFQPQNLPRGILKGIDVATARSVVREGDVALLDVLYLDTSKVLSSLVRSAIAAPPGKKLVVADLASIETVMVAWEADSEYLLALLREGRDPYKDFASRLFGVPYAAVTKTQRNLAKPAVLGGVYGLGAVGLQKYATGFGLVIGDEEAKKHVQVFRDAYADIPILWERLTRAAFSAVRTPGTPYPAGRCCYQASRGYLWCKLPSGRCIGYREPRVQVDETQWGPREQLSYLEREGQNMRVATFHGRLLENNTQAIARDILAAGLVRAEADPGLEVIGHVHDEILCLANEHDHTALARLITHMTTLPPWADGVPLGASGWEGPYYRKD
ncbi:DNA polymerase [uncultured Thiodictyon sp.]|uniref:DNA polymerase n=1 Tax=uncultured Thiodictyon sp. TaxID=1846217 RepID=UPI0025F1B67C|nr:DNA polymerase [uncultured Thiodictyon sp.]